MIGVVDTPAALLFVTGALAFSIAALGVWGVAARSLDWPLAAFLAVISTVIVTGWISVILASLNSYAIGWIGLIEWAFSVGLFFRFRRRPRSIFRAPTRYELGLVVLLIGSAVVYFRPHEYVLGGTDAGTYLNISSTLAQTGQFVVTGDDWSRLMRDYPDVTLRRQPPAWQTRYLQFVGYYLDDADAGRIIPQFLPFHPALIAAGTSLGGLKLGLLVTPLWGVLSLAAVYFAARQLFDRRVALLAATLLALTPTHIYFARYPTTEPLTLLLVFSGLLAFQVLIDDRSAPALWGVFGGAAFGAAVLTRIDLPLVLALIGVALIAVRVRGQWTRAWTWFTLTLGVFTAHMLIDLIAINWPYAWNTYGSVARLLERSPVIAAGGAAGMIAAVIAVIVLRRRWRRRTLSSAARQRGRWLLAGGLVALSAFAYFVRPVIEPIRFVTAWPGNVQYPVLDSQNWVRIGWYLTPLGLLLATWGAAWLMRRAALLRLGLFLAVGVLTTIQYVYNIFNTPYHIYAMRRYVPIVLPTLMILAAYALWGMWDWRRRWLTRGAALALTLGLMAGLIYQARFVLPQRDFFGAVDALTALNAQLKPNAIVVMVDPPESSLADAFGVPLRFTFGHDVATIRSEDEAAVATVLDRVLARAAASDRPVQLLTIDPLPAAVHRAIDLQPKAGYSFTLRALMGTFYDYPSVIQPAYYGFEIYDVQRKDARAAPLPLEIDVGTLDAAYLRSGFYSKDILPDGVSARWTSDRAIIDLPLMDAASITITVRALTFRPPDLPPAEVSVSLDGREIGRFTPRYGEWQTYSFQAQPRPAGGSSTLAFSTSSFNPAALHLSADDRALGFVIDRVQILPR